MTRRASLPSLLVLALATSGCGDSRATSAVCTFKGVTYQPGQSFAAGDGCNTCVCNPGAASDVMCTARGCNGQPQPIGTCIYEGKTYRTGEVFPAADGCNSCRCNPEGTTGVGCSMKLCPAPACPEVAVPAAAGSELEGKACSPDKLHCTYLIDDCDNEYIPIEWSCDCQGVWKCSRGYDCPRDWRRDAGAPRLD